MKSVMANTLPRWSQDQAIAYEAACEAVNDVIAGYSADIAAEQAKPAPDRNRIAYLEMRTDQCCAVLDALHVTDDVTIAQVRSEYGAIVRARAAAAHLADAA